MTRYERAEQKYKKAGASKVQGDALTYMYAKLTSDSHGGDPVVYFNYLADKPEKAAKHILADRAAAWDVLMGISA